MQLRLCLPLLPLLLGGSLSSLLSLSSLPLLPHLLSDTTRGAPGEDGTARVFPLLPPYQNVDFGANFNKLKSSGDAAYFVVRDSTVFIAVNVMWAAIHYLIWDGKVSNTQDIISSLLSPGVDVQLSDPSDTSRLGFDSLAELSPTKLWNFFTDPNPSTRNLYLNIGFASFSHLLWILPTFLGIIPSTARLDGAASGLEERLDGSIPGIPANLAGADPVALWNRLLSPQGVIQMLAINTLNYLGKLLFWTFMAVVPDAATGRSQQGEQSWLTQVAAGFTDNVAEAAWRLELVEAGH